ncbi:MAG TPA: hypothetical protein VLX09_12315 [Stellaceae bacterium]|nr:hypothetical protein [Stellaceae bacterium]
MKHFSLIYALSIMLVMATGAASAQGNFTHFNGSQQDNGTTTPLPNGGTQTTYNDGWTQTTEPDNSFGPGGTKVTEKDKTGRIQAITNYDPKKRKRHQTRVAYNANGTMTLSHADYDADGHLIDSKTETTQSAPPPQPGPQTAQPGGPPADSAYGGPPPGSGGPPPDSGPGFGGPVFGGFGFGVTIGGDRERRP